MIREGVIIGERYEIIGRIGAGGMADVYKAHDHKLNRPVAVKVLKREFREDETFVKKFQTEAQAAAGLMHANIVNVYDVGEDRGLYYFVMELVEGITLKDYIQKKGRLTVKEVISISLQVCAGIEAAHNHQIIHRDIKPQNIIISREGKVKVMDFGIAKATSSNTINTNAMGSVHYSSPEQARGGFIDTKSDIYSLGVTMYEMITGELPFDGDSTVTIALKHLQEEVVPPSQYVPEIPYSLERIILKCMQKSPNRRYANTMLLAKDLRHSLSDPEGDFVVITPAGAAGHTVVRSKEEIEQIRKARYTPEEETQKEEKQRKNPVSNADEEVNKNMSKVIRILAIVAIVISAILLVLGVIKMVSCIGGMGGVDSGAQTQNEKRVEVPPLVGEEEDVAKKLCEDSGLKMEVIAYEKSEDFDEGIITSQKTAAGAKVYEDTKIQVVVSSGLKPPTVEIPDVADKEEEEALEALTDAGFIEDNITIEQMSSDEIEAGRAISTDPKAGTELAVDQELTLFISTGIEKGEVPVLVGLTKKEARKSLKSAGLIPVFVEEYNTDYAAGYVYEQAVEAGTEVDKGTEITCYVSLGTEMVTIPTNLTGKTVYVVDATLSNLGLHVKVIKQVSYEYNKDMVIAVPQSGDSVALGSEVEVYVSSGPGPSQEEPTEPTA